MDEPFPWISTSPKPASSLWALPYISLLVLILGHGIDATWTGVSGGGKVGRAGGRLLSNGD